MTLARGAGSVQAGVGGHFPQAEELGELPGVDRLDDDLPEARAAVAEDVLGGGGQGEPGIDVELALELARPPAGIVGDDERRLLLAADDLADLVGLDRAVDARDDPLV